MPSAREGTRPQRALSRKAFLAATAGSLVAVGAGLVAADRLLIPQRLDEVADGSRLYDYVVDGTKFDAVDWTLANMSDVGRLSLGSSEFYISKNLVAQCPQAVFGESNCGIDLTYIGEAYDQSLWQTIAAGAYAQQKAPGHLSSRSGLALAGDCHIADEPARDSAANANRRRGSYRSLRNRQSRCRRYYWCQGCRYSRYRRCRQF